MSKSPKEVIRRGLKSKINVSYTIKPLNKVSSDMEKQLFIETLDNLKQIEDRKGFMIEELGLDLTIYENKFFKVIENLFYMHFNQDQLEIIMFYLYETQFEEDHDGKITIEKNKDKKTMPFETSNDVWKVVQLLK
jgi:hypothetical protein